jgi:hypothetical protein
MITIPVDQLFGRGQSRMNFLNLVAHILADETKSKWPYGIVLSLQICSVRIFIPDSAVQTDTLIKRQASGFEGNRPAACSALQSPVPQRTPGKMASPETRTIDGTEIVRFHAFAPLGSPIDRYTCIQLYCGIRVDKDKSNRAWKLIIFLSRCQKENQASPLLPINFKI